MPFLKKEPKSSQLTLTQCDDMFKTPRYRVRPQPKKSVTKKASPPRAYDEDDVEVLEIPKIEAKKTVIDLSSDSEEDTLRSLKTVTPSPPMGVNSPPAVKQSADFVRPFRLAKVKIEKEACQTPIRDFSDKKDSSVGPPGNCPMPQGTAGSVDGAIRALSDEKRRGIWITGLAIGFEDQRRAQICNKNIGEAIQDYLKECARQRVLMTAKFNSNFQVSNQEELQALHDVSRIVPVMKYRLDVVDEYWLKRSFPPMKVGDVCSWFKTFVHNFFVERTKYEVVPFVNIKNGTYELKIEWNKDPHVNKKAKT